MNAADKSESIPLIDAPAIGSVKAIDALLQIGANIDKQNRDGYTPLLDAIHFAHSKVDKRLI